MQDWVSRLSQKGSLVAKIAKVKWLIVLHQPFYDLLLQLLICSFLHATVVTTVYSLDSKTSATFDSFLAGLVGNQLYSAQTAIEPVLTS